jgi:hypothetical protein
MTDPVKTDPHKQSPETGSGTSRLWLAVGAAAIVVAVLFVWLTSVPNGMSTAPEINADTIEIEEETEEAPVPVEDANPNPVVPQDSLIPPAPVDDAPPD